MFEFYEGMQLLQILSTLLHHTINQSTIIALMDKTTYIYIGRHRFKSFHIYKKKNKCNNPRKTLGTSEFKTFYPKKTIQVTITTPYICL
jgi:tRNA U38,U39,U40 pseudouridine synthase TruA